MSNNRQSPRRPTSVSASPRFPTAHHHHQFSSFSALSDATIINNNFNFSPNALDVAKLGSPSPSTPSSPLPSSSPSQMPCADFLMRGFCKFGDHCLFTHELAPVYHHYNHPSPPSSPFPPHTPPHHHRQQYNNRGGGAGSPHHRHNPAAYDAYYSNPASSSTSQQTSPSSPSVSLSAPEMESDVASSSHHSDAVSQNPHDHHNQSLGQQPQQPPSSPRGRQGQKHQQQRQQQQQRSSPHRRQNNKKYHYGRSGMGFYAAQQELQIQTHLAQAQAAYEGGAFGHAPPSAGFLLVAPPPTAEASRNPSVSSASSSLGEDKGAGQQQRRHPHQHPHPRSQQQRIPSFSLAHSNSPTSPPVPSFLPNYGFAPLLSHRLSVPFLIPHQNSLSAASASASSSSEIYDFSDGEDAHDGDREDGEARGGGGSGSGSNVEVVVEKPRLVAMYECNKVGVLGGGVKLGARRRSASLSQPPLDVRTRDEAAGLFEDDSEAEGPVRARGEEVEYEDDEESDVEVVIDCLSEAEPWNVPLPPSAASTNASFPPVSREATIVPTPTAAAVAIQVPPAPSSVPPPVATELSPMSSPSIPKLSWADYDDGDDDGYFSSTGTLFGQAVPEVADTQAGGDVAKPLAQITPPRPPRPRSSDWETVGRGVAHSSSKDRRKERRATVFAAKEQEDHSVAAGRKSPKLAPAPGMSAWTRGPPPSLGASPVQTRERPTAAPPPLAIALEAQKSTSMVAQDGLHESPTRSTKKLPPFPPSSPPPPPAAAGRWKPLPRLPSNATIHEGPLADASFPTLSEAATIPQVKAARSPNPNGSPEPARSPLLSLYPNRSPDISLEPNHPLNPEEPNQASSSTSPRPSSRNQNRNRNRNRSRSRSTAANAHMYQPWQYPPPPQHQQQQHLGGPASPVFNNNVHAAPEIYNRLGFVLSPEAAREIEHLRVVESERLRRQGDMARQYDEMAARSRMGVQPPPSHEFPPQPYMGSPNAGYGWQYYQQPPPQFYGSGWA